MTTHYATKMLCSVGITVFATPTAAAQQAPTTIRIGAGDLDGALRAYSRITGRQILYRPQDVKDRKFAGMDANIEADAALSVILRGSGLVVERPAANVYVLRSSARAAKADDDVPSENRASVTEEVVVTGTNIRGGEANGPVRTLNRRAFEQSGKATIADLVAAQTANFGGSGNPVASLTGIDQASLNYSMSPAANLRGLGTDATLTLFDGRRVAGSGGRGDFTDLSAIPSLAVERVEILPDGASAIYGSDAVAGVVNLILRRQFDGLEVRLRGAIATRGEPRSAIGGVVVGEAWRSGSALVAYEFEHRDRLSSADRSYTASGDLRPFGGSDRRTFYAAPGNILAFSPSAGAFVPAYAIPTLTRQPTAADLRPGQNFGNRFALSDLSPRIDRHSVFGRIEQGAGDKVELFIEGRYSRRSFDYYSPASVSVLSVGPANPHFIPIAGQASSLIGYSFLTELGPARVAGDVSAISLTGGLSWRLGEWTIDAFGSYARERSSDLSSNQLNTTSLAEALGNVPDNPSTAYSATRDGYFNPYGSGASNSAATLAFIGSGYALSARRSSLSEASAKADGPLFGLPGGDIRLAVGSSYRREAFENRSENFYSGIVPTATAGIPGNRDIKSAFAELLVPVFGPGSAGAGVKRLSLSAAVRVDDYSDFGTTTNPKLGASYSPADGVTVRGSFGTSFRAPALSEVNDPLRVIATVLPNASGASIPVIFLTGGNRSLGPETANTISGGVLLQPAGIPGLRWEANLFRTHFNNRIAQPALEDFARALSNPALATYVRLVSPTRNAADLAAVTELLSSPGAVVGTTPAAQYGAIVDGRFVNTSSLDVSGLDLDVGIARTLGPDRIEVSLSATWLFQYRQTLTPLSAPVDRLDTLGNPVNLRVRGTTAWSRGPFSAALTANYVDSYKDDVSIPARGIAPFFTLDANVGFAVSRGPLAKTRFSLSVENIFDTDPPFVNRVNGFGFDAGSASPSGRTVALEFRSTF